MTITEQAYSAGARAFDNGRDRLDRNRWTREGGVMNNKFCALLGIKDTIRPENIRATGANCQRQ